MLQPYQDRVIAEKHGLDQNLAKLNGFLAGEGTRNLALEDLKLLSDQQYAMQLYSNTLAKRIARF